MSDSISAPSRLCPSCLAWAKGATTMCCRGSCAFSKTRDTGCMEPVTLHRSSWPVRGGSAITRLPLRTEPISRLRSRWSARLAASTSVKPPKPGQEERVDLPTIGPETVGKAASAGLAGIAVAAGQVLMAERAATIAGANQHGLFLVGEALTEQGGA